MRRDAIHQHSVPTGPSCQGGFLPSGTFPREPVLGSPRLVQEGPASKQNTPGCPRPCQGSASSHSGPSTLGAAGSMVIPECARWWHIHQGSPVPARRHPRSQLLPQPSPSATAQEARDWGRPSSSFQERGVHFSRAGALITTFQLCPEPECLPLPGVCV